ncbi:hypothetical protein AAHC03_013798 [Spirometra sp. Aus1]
MEDRRLLCGRVPLAITTSAGHRVPSGKRTCGSLGLFSGTGGHDLFTVPPPPTKLEVPLCLVHVCKVAECPPEMTAAPSTRLGDSKSQARLQDTERACKLLIFQLATQTKLAEIKNGHGLQSPSNDFRSGQSAMDKGGCVGACWTSAQLFRAFGAFMS